MTSQGLMQDVDIYSLNVSAICGYLHVYCFLKHFAHFGTDILTFDIVGIVLASLCVYSHLCFISPDFKPHYHMTESCTKNNNVDV